MLSAENYIPPKFWRRISKDNVIGGIKVKQWYFQGIKQFLMKRNEAVLFPKNKTILNGEKWSSDISKE